MEMGIRRRSPRITAISSANHQLSITTPIHSIKRKFDGSTFLPPVSKLAKQVWKGRDSPHDHHSTDCVQWRSTGDSSQTVIQKHDGKASIMPDKHTLELVLDTLQRRDSYEIFAEPVDPDEVEDYYEIIKEPMDFGTMRAKLHEGMYQNLEQFEHDLFLIPENAMHFNSSSSIYFRQARALHELAKKVFDAFKADQENFVSEFSGTRRRSMRKALMNRCSDKKTCFQGTKTHRNISSKRNNSRKNYPIVTSHPLNTTGVGDNRDGRLCESACRHRQMHDWRSSSSFYHLQQNTTLPLVMMIKNEGEYSYKDSLMAYVKDLGPTAQMIAKRKLFGESNNNDLVGLSSTATATKQSKPDDCLAANHHQVLLFKTFRDFAPAAGSNPFLHLLKKPTNPVIHLTLSNQNDAPHIGEKNKRNRGHNFGGKHKIDKCPSSHRNNRVLKKGIPTNNISPHAASCFRSSEDNVRPVILALENYSYSNNANATEFKSRNTRSSSLVTATDGQKRGKLTPLSPSSISQFTFDIPFLKARLHQMNPPSLGKGGGGGGGRGGGLNLAIKPPFLYNHQPTNHSFDSNVPLQLI